MPKAAFHLAGKTYTVKKEIQANPRYIAARSRLDEPSAGSISLSCVISSRTILGPTSRSVRALKRLSCARLAQSEQPRVLD
jgi:hypothetical protein